MRKYKKIWMSMVFCGLFAIILGIGLELNVDKMDTIENEPYGYLAYNTEKYRYLSDIKYEKNQSSVGWGSITLDKNLESGVNNGLISLIVDGNQKSFFKGISAHATSTLVYDLSEYKYDYFTTYYGVDASRGNNGNGVKFSIYTSTDGKNWDLKTEENPKALKGTDNSAFVKIDIKNAKYLKLYADNNGNQDSDHAVYANAKLIKEDYVESTKEPTFIKTLEEYDRLIKEHDGEEIKGDYELLLLQRELVNCVGYDMLKLYAGVSEEHYETLSWLFNDLDNLELYILGGKPEISRTFDPTTQKDVNANENYLSSLEVLNRLYQTYKDDFTIQEKTKYGNKLGDLYKRMAMALSLTHSRTIALWMQTDVAENQSDPVERYQIYKDLHKNGKFEVKENMDVTKWFEEMTVEELRLVLNNAIDNEEILWLNEYTQSFVDSSNGDLKYLTPHPYMAYVTPDYGNTIFHDPDKKEYWDEKFNGIFSKYGVTYSSDGRKIYKVWMNLRNEYGTGAVCGGISKTGSNIRAVHGIPSTVVSQPGHAALIYYQKNADGKGYWSLDNDVSGWAQSGRTESLNNRMPLGYGNQEYIHFHQDWLGMATYVLLAQGALNDFDNYKVSRETLILADVYQDDNKKLNEIYRNVVKKEPLNIDGWYGIIKTYRNDSTKTEEDYLNLSKEIMEELKYYPLPMYHLTREVKKNIVSPKNDFSYALELDRTLNDAKNVTDKESIQKGAVKQEAEYLLGQVDNTLATFSFDGENAGKLVLASRYDGIGIRWDYSIAGKKDWKEVSFTADEEHKLQLSKQELDSINAENDIYVHIVGVDYNEENLYKIDIKEQEAPTTIYNNDLENKVIGATDKMEWRMVNSKKSKAVDNDGWTSFKDSEPDLTGDKTVEVRIGKTGVYLESESVTLDYTTDVIDETKKYIPISHLSIENVSTEATGKGRHAKNAIDGNYNTNWHSAWDGSDNDKYITIKIDTPMYLSSLDYVPSSGGNGKILEGQILGSLDGKNYQPIGTVKWDNDEEIKTIDFDNPMKLQYVKIVGTKTSSAGGGSFISARMFNLYEDATKRVIPKADIKYDITTETDKNVVATLVNPTTEITVTNNDGKTSYTFIENGTFTFEFVDKEGNKGQATATVNWIKKNTGTSDVEDNDKPVTDNNTNNETSTKPGTDNSTNNGTSTKPGTDNSTNNGTSTKPETDNSTNNGTSTKPGTDNSTNNGTSTKPGTDNSTNNGTNTKPETDNNTNNESSMKPGMSINQESGNQDVVLNMNGEDATLVEVPDTSSDAYAPIIGILIILLGIGFVYYHSRQVDLDEVE